MSRSQLEHLQSLMESKRGMLQAIVDLCVQQTMVLQSEDVDALDALLGQKQQLMERIDLLDLELAQAWSGYGLPNWEDLSSSGTERSLLETRFAVKALLEQAIKHDNQNHELSRLLLLKLEQELQQSGRANDASRAYAGANQDTSSPAFFMNRKL